jgi:hypothetical protein
MWQVHFKEVHPLELGANAVCACVKPSSNHNHLQHMQNGRSRPVSAHRMSWFEMYVCVEGRLKTSGAKVNVNLRLQCADRPNWLPAARIQ